MAFLATKAERSRMALELLRDNAFAGHAAAGTCSVAACLTHPLDTLKTLLQTGAGSSQQLRLPQVVERVQTALGCSIGSGWILRRLKRFPLAMTKNGKPLLSLQLLE